MKKLLLIFIITTLGSFFFARVRQEPLAILGAPSTGETFHKSLIPITDNLYDLGTTSPTQRRFKNVFAVTGRFTDVVVSGTCTGCSSFGAGTTTIPAVLSPAGFDGLFLTARTILLGTGSATGTKLVGGTGSSTFAGPVDALGLSSSSGGITTTGGLNVAGLTSALTLTGSTGAFAEYAGTSCTNQFVRSLSALGAATCETVANTDLANSTISGVALGGSLFALTNDDTLSGSSYNGSAAISDWGLNLANSNVWSGLQHNTNTGTTTYVGGFKTNAGFDGLFASLRTILLGTGSATTTKIAGTGTSTIANGIELATSAGSVNIGTTTPYNGRKLTVDGAIAGCTKTLATGATIAVNFNDCNTAEVVLANTGATMSLTGGKAGDHKTLIVYPDAAGRTITSWGSNVFFTSSNVAGPTATTAPWTTQKAGACNVFTFVVGNGTSTNPIYIAPMPTRCY